MFDHDGFEPIDHSGPDYSQVEDRMNAARDDYVTTKTPFLSNFGNVVLKPRSLIYGLDTTC